jgi:UPF0271 protein
MTRHIDINCDMAESFGAYEIGNDAELLQFVSSANVACGFHAGDPSVMHRFVLAAKEAGIGIGAHPGFPDLQGFGRRPMQMKPAEVEHMVAYQIGALQAMAAYAGLRVGHVKAHGALSNMAARDHQYAMAIGRAIQTVDASLVYVVHYGSEMQRAAERLGLEMACEGYADRAYDDDGNLAPRSAPGAVIHSPEAALAQVLRMVLDGEIVSRTGKVLKVEVDTVCVHGDEPTAAAVAARVRHGLEAAGVLVTALGSTAGAIGRAAA